MAGLVFMVTCVEENVFLKWNALEKVSISNFLGSIWTHRINVCKHGSLHSSTLQDSRDLTGSALIGQK